VTRRSGITLIELLVVITTSMLIVGLAAGMVHVLLRAHRTTEDHLVRSVTVRRLCEAVRKEVWAANAANCAEVENASRLELKFDANRRVEFRASDQAVIRTDYQAGRALLREKYLLPGKSRARFEVVTGTNGSTVRLVIENRPDPLAETAWKKMHVEAAVGRDLRFVPRVE